MRFSFPHPPTFFLLLQTMTLAFSGCAPQSKEAYLEQYREFVNDVRDNHDSYSDEVWMRKNEKFMKFKGEWYDKFEDEFTIGEELKLAKYALTYNMAKANNGASELIQALKEDEDIQDLKEQIRFYVDNDMEEDIDNLVKEAGKAGDETARALRELLDAMNVEVKVKTDDGEAE